MGKERGGGPEPLFLPAAFCSLVAIPLTVAWGCSERPEAFLAAAFMWGASIYLWKENARLSGGKPPEFPTFNVEGCF
jgi:hypothetical protein